MKISNLSQEPNPFEQSFESTLVKDEKDPRLQNKFSLPSISLIGQGSHLLPDEPIKLSPLILDPSSQGKGESQLPHSLQHSVRPPSSYGPTPSPLSQVASSFPNPGGVPTSHSALSQKVPQGSMYNPHSQLPPWSGTSQVARPPSLSGLPDAHSQAGLLNNYPPSYMPIRPLTSAQMGPPKHPMSYMVPMTKNLGAAQARPSKKSAGGRKRLPTDGMSPKKIDFLERNRKAALKCRQRKKDEYKRVEETMRLLEYNNTIISKEIQVLTQEAMKLRSLLASHGFCPVAQAAGVMGEATLPNSTQLILPPHLHPASYHNRM